MSLPKKLSATKAMLVLLLWCSCTLALAAQVAGTVVQLSGPLLARKASGAVKILSLKSEVESGDTLVTEKNTYAMVRFIDNSEMTLKPATTMKIDSYAFDNAKPDGDAANFSLVKGGLRSVTGLLGKRNKEKFELKTPSATIGIRGTTFVAEYVPPDEERALASLQAWLNASTAALGDSVMPVAPLQLAQGPLPPPPAGRPPAVAGPVCAGARWPDPRHQPVRQLQLFCRPVRLHAQLQAAAGARAAESRHAVRAAARFQYIDARQQYRPAGQVEHG
jgi:hypothetical protein